MKMTDEWIKEIFGNNYELTWNGHNHFVRDRLTNDFYYVVKKEKILVSQTKFSEWYYARHYGTPTKESR